MVDFADTVFRDFETDGVPASGTHKPQKAKIREWGGWLEGIIAGGEAAASVATRIALKAIDTETFGQAILREEGRAGIFVWRAGDYSAEVAADTQEGVFIKADAIASTAGAWVRVHNGRLLAGWFGAVNDDGATDSYSALACGLAVSALLEAPFHFHGQYGIGTKLTIAATTMLSADRRSRLRAFGGLADCIEISAGNAHGENMLPRINDFTGIAMRMRCNMGRYKCPVVENCGTAVQFYASGANNLDSIVHVEQVTGCTKAVEFYADDAARVTQGCGLEYNFITTTKFPVVFDGVAWSNDGNFCRGEAIDLTADEADGAVLDNRTGDLIIRFTLEVRCWLGGAGFTTSPFAKLALGQWNGADLRLTNAQEFTTDNIAANRIQASRVSTRNMNSTPRTLSQTSGLANYNGGVADSLTALAVECVTATDWLAGGLKDFYFYNIWADRTYDVWTVTPRSMPPGVILTQVFDEDSIEQGQVRLRFVNNSSATLTAPKTMQATVMRV